MTSNNECYVYIMLPDTTQFVTAARFQHDIQNDGIGLGRFM